MLDYTPGTTLEQMKAAFPLKKRDDHSRHAHVASPCNVASLIVTAIFSFSSSARAFKNNCRNLISTSCSVPFADFKTASKNSRLPTRTNRQRALLSKTFILRKPVKKPRAFLTLE